MTKRGWILVAVAAAALVLLVGGPSVITATGAEPATCATCHSMQEFRTTHAQSDHAAVACTQCHLPQGLASIPAKYEAGFKHVWATITGYEEIQLSAESEQILLDNCIACHIQTDHVRVPDNRGCLNCHFDDPHGVREDRTW